MNETHPEQSSERSGFAGRANSARESVEAELPGWWPLLWAALAAVFVAVFMARAVGVVATAVLLVVAAVALAAYVRREGGQ